MDIRGARDPRDNGRMHELLVPRETAAPPLAVLGPGGFGKEKYIFMVV